MRMDRIKNFQDTVEHRQLKDIVMDLGGCPLSSVEGQTQARLLRYLGYDAPDDAPLLFGKVRQAGRTPAARAGYRYALSG